MEGNRAAWNDRQDDIPINLDWITGTLTQYRVDDAGEFVKVAVVERIKYKEAQTHSAPELVSIWDSGLPGILPIVMCTSETILKAWRVKTKWRN